MTATKKKDESKELTQAQTGGAVAAYNYGDDAGAGMETVKGEDLAIPFLNVVQTNSKAVEEASAKGGQLFNTVTGELIEGDAGVVFIPCYKQELFVEWVPRDNGGGFVGVHAPESEVVKKALEAVGGNKFTDLKVGSNDLIETHYVYGLVLNNEGTEVDSFAVIAFTSTKIKVWKGWLTSMYMLKGKPPIFANRARIKTVKQKKDNYSFYNLKVEPLKSTWLESLINPVTESVLIEAAKTFKQQIESGVAKVNFAQQDSADAKSGEKATGATPGGDAAF